VWDLDILARGEALLRELDETIKRMERAREAALAAGNDVLAEQVQIWLPPALKTRGLFMSFLLGVSEGLMVRAHSEACSLSNYLGKLLSAVDLSGPRYVTEGLRTILVKIYGFSREVCSSEG
jgi:hypothetical protein